MAIFSMASDLTTREIRYVPRKTETSPQSVFAGQIQAHEGWWFAGIYADRYHDEAVAAIPTFE
jgi:hypothetical protein